MNQKIYKGAIIEESLEDTSVLSGIEILKTDVTDDENPEDRWHIHTVNITIDKIRDLSKVIKPNKFYAHFWDTDKNIVVVFKDKIFELNFDDKASWQPAIEYGISVGIPKEQLDFLID